MIDVILFLFFVVIPFFRLCDGRLLENLHNIIAVVGIGGVILGIIHNKLDKYIDTLIRFMIPVLLSTIAVHFFLKTYDSAQIKITLLELGGPLVLILWLIKRINLWDFKISPSRKYILVPAVLFLLSGILSFILSQFKVGNFEEGLLRRISYLGVFLVIIYEFNHKDDFKRILNWTLASLVIVVAYGFIQKFGWDWHIWAGAFGRSVFSTFGNPNFYAAWLVLVFPLIFAKIMLTKKWYYIVIAVGIFLNLYYTGTKGSWVGLGMEISIFIILATLYLIKGNPQLLKRIAVIITVGIMMFTTVVVVRYSMKRIISIRFRLFTWGSTMKMISEPIFVHPVKAVFLGHGIESFNEVYPAYRRPEIFRLEGKHNTQTDHAHNEYLEMFYEEGLVGITIFLWFLISIYYAAIKRLSLMGVGGAKSEDEFYLVALIAGTIGMLAHAGVCVHMRFVSSGYILWIFMGLLVVHTAPSNVKIIKKQRKGLNTGPGLLIIIALLGVAVYNSFHASRRFIANIYHNRAIAFSKQRVWDQAISYYKKVQAYSPSFVMAYYFEGNVYNDRLSEAIDKQNNEEIELFYKKALQMYEKVRSMYPDYVQIHFQEGMLHLRVGRVEEAVQSFRKYLNIVDPVYEFTYYRMGMVKAGQNEIEKSEWYFKEATERKPHIAETFLNLANMYLSRGKFAEAKKIYTEAIKIHENNFQILNSLGFLYEKMGKREDAMRTYQKILDFQPDNKEIIEKINNLKT